MKKVDQQVISTQIRSHYLYWSEKVHNVIVRVLCGVLGTRNRDSSMLREGDWDHFRDMIMNIVNPEVYIK